jgi:hypothetical protein
MYQREKSLTAWSVIPDSAIPSGIVAIHHILWQSQSERDFTPSVHL